MDAAVYLRISEDRSGEQLGVTRHREDCLALCPSKGWRPVEYMDNDTSATRGKPWRAYERMLADVRPVSAEMGGKSAEDPWFAMPFATAVVVVTGREQWGETDHWGGSNVGGVGGKVRRRLRHVQLASRGAVTSQSQGVGGHRQRSVRVAINEDVELVRGDASQSSEIQQR